MYNGLKLDTTGIIYGIWDGKKWPQITSIEQGPQNFWGKRPPSPTHPQ